MVLLRARTSAGVVGLLDGDDGGKYFNFIDIGRSKLAAETERAYAATVSVINAFALRHKWYRRPEDFHRWKAL